jgi:hypothetical protein
MGENGTIYTDNQQQPPFDERSPRFEAALSIRFCTGCGYAAPESREGTLGNRLRPRVLTDTKSDQRTSDQRLHATMICVDVSP